MLPRLARLRFSRAALRTATQPKTSAAKNRSFNNRNGVGNVKPATSANATQGRLLFDKAVKDSAAKAGKGKTKTTRDKAITLAKFAGFNLLLQVMGVGAAWWVNEAADRDKLSLRDEDFPLVYNGEALEAFWAQHMNIVMSRVGEVTLSSLPFLFKIFTLIGKNYLFPVTDVEDAEQRESTSEEQRLLAVQLRELLVSLGPAFVKLGQVLSTRPDFFPGPVLQELQQLCDSVPSFSSVRAMEMIEREIGGPVGSLYVGLDEHSTPVAAASLGQVYRCKMKRKGPKGEELVDVAVKVQRPDMIQAVSLDLYVMRNCMHYVELVKGFLMQVGILAQRKQFNINMFDSFASASYYEVDYEHEATNQEKFAKKLTELGMHKVYIPKVYRGGTRRRVLTTEWIEGLQLSKSDPKVRSYIKATLQTLQIS
jgi:hypothetical protein